MLILTRSPGKRIMVGDDIVIKVLSISRNQVSIGIEAPDCVPVHREEIWLEIKKEQDIYHKLKEEKERES